MFVYWPWVGLIAVISVVVAVLVIKLSNKLGCGVRMTTLPERHVSTYNQHQEDDFEVLSDGNIDFNLQAMDHGGQPDRGYPPAEDGGYSIGGGGYPDGGGGVYPDQVDCPPYPSSQADYGPSSGQMSSRHEYAL